MNGCHVPGQTGAIQNPAYRPTGDFPPDEGLCGFDSAFPVIALKCMNKSWFMARFCAPFRLRFRKPHKPFIKLNGL
jgi:hypothetical protein